MGNNIIEGIMDLMKENSTIELNIMETTESNKYRQGIFAHSRIGENLKPETKIKDFVKFISGDIGNKWDVVAMKLCYVDITKNHNIEEIFKNYHESVEEVRKRYPDLVIIHFTAPLTVSKASWKTWIKKIMGKGDFWEYNDNVKRNQYNELIRREYKGKDPILDIARIESTKPDGTMQSFELKNKTFYSLVPEYTYDGGHLNITGRQKVAEQFILLLANMN